MTINFNEVQNSYRPRRAIELAWDQSSGGSATGLRDIYIMGEILAAGTATAGDVTTTPFADADAGVAFFGADSFGAYMVRQVFRQGSLGALKSRVYGVACAEATTAATQILTIANNAGTAGTWTMNCAGATFSWTVEASDTPTTSGDNLVAAFDALSVDVAPPCQPVNAAGVVTFTMSTKGANANTAPFYMITTGSEPTTQTATANDVTFGTDNGAAGAVAGVGYPTITTPLANMVDVETPIIVCGWDETPDGSTTNLDLIRAHLETKCNAENMMRGACVFALSKTVATVVSDVAALDDSDAERMRCCSDGVNAVTNQDSPGSWHVAQACWVANALAAEPNMTRPFDGVSLPHQTAPPASSAVLTNTELDTLIEGGITPLHYDSTRGRVVIVRGVSCRLFGGVPQDWSIVDAIDLLRYYIDVDLEAAFPRFKLGQDGELNLDEYTTTPAGVLDVIHDTIFSDRMKGHLRNREDLWAAASAEINSSYAGRVDWTVDAAVMDALHILAGKIRQRGGVI